MYQRSLGLIVRDMKHGNVDQRMRAARQIGSLLAMVRQIEQGKAKPPKNLEKKVTKPVLLTMLREILKDTNEVVRAEMLNALLNVSLDESILQLLGNPISDSSALVRFRAVELLAALKSSGSETIIDHLTKDKDELVQLMAQAFKKR